MMSLFKKNKNTFIKAKKRRQKSFFCPLKVWEFLWLIWKFHWGGDTKEKVEGLNTGLHEYDYKM